MRDAYGLAAYELAAYEMAYVRGMLMRCTPTMKDIREARLWDGLCEKHAYEMARL
jgi:hypothetical protein